MIFACRADGESNGVLEEAAGALVSSKLPGLTAAQTQEGIKFANSNYVAQGITSANEGATFTDGVQALEAAAKAGSLEAGKIADMAVLSASSLDVDPMAIKGIKELETSMRPNRISCPDYSREPGSDDE